MDTPPTKPQAEAQARGQRLMRLATYASVSVAAVLMLARFHRSSLRLIAQAA